MRWVGKMAVTLLLFLSVFILYAHGESVLSAKDLNERNGLFSVDGKNETTKDQGTSSFEPSNISDDRSSLETSTDVSAETTTISDTTNQPDVKGEDFCKEKKPCLNGGSCEPKGKTDYECKCVVGYIGKNCEDVEWCKKNEGICGTEPCLYNANTGSGFCSCKEASYFDAKHKKCKELDKCLNQRIKGNCSGDHETCDETGKCICKKNYAYNEDQKACEADFCGKKSKKPACGMNMECIEEGEGFSCICKEGFRQFGKTCVKVNKCAPGESNCQQKCRNGKCSCFEGFKINDDNHTCDPEESTSVCDLDCGPGTCVKVGASEMCICPEISHILKGNTCIDKCTAGRITDRECPVGCISDGYSGYKCNCTGKYEFADDKIHCKAKRMCSEEGGNEDCALKGGFCEDDFAKPNGYECKCKFGYEKDPETNKCRHKCETANCDKIQALCAINVKNEAECICPPLFIKDPTGKCGLLAKYSYLGDFLVPKNKYQVVTAEDSARMKRSTFKDIDYAKLLKDFEESMENIFDGYNGASVLNCTNEYDDFKCFLEIKLDEDPKGKLNILSTPSVCLPLSDKVHCLIPPNFETRMRTAEEAQVFKKTDPCDKGVIGNLCGKDTKCEASKAGFECECINGYLKRTFYVPAPNAYIEVCEDENECLNPTICPNTTRCSNLPGNYICECIDGYSLENGKSVKEEGCRAVCNPSPCVNGKCLVTGRNGFSCSCDELHTGRFCNKTNDAITGIKKEGYQTSAILGGVLGALLVIAIIISIILFRKIQKQKTINETEEYVRQRKRGLASEMRKLGRRQPENDDVVLRDNERRLNRETEDQKFNAQHRMNPIESMSIPRPQLGRSTDKRFDSGHDMPERRGSGDYRKGYTGDDRMFPKAHSSRNSGEEARRSNPRDDRQEQSRRPLSRTPDYLDNEKIGVSRMQYRNRGYEEE